jgi:hypothetical protein
MSKIFSKLGKEYLMQAIPFTDKEIFHPTMSEEKSITTFQYHFQNFIYFPNKINTSTNVGIKYSVHHMFLK